MVAPVSCSCTLLAARDKLQFQIFILKERLTSSNPKTAVVPQGPSRGVTRSQEAGMGHPPSTHGPGGSGNGGRAAPSCGAARWRWPVRALPTPGPGGCWRFRRPGADTARLEQGKEQPQPSATEPARLRQLSEVLRADSLQASPRLPRQGRCPLQPQD